MKLFALTNGRVCARRGIFAPGVPDSDQKFYGPCPFFVVEHPDARVLIDTGCHPSGATDPFGRWGGLANAITQVAAPDEGTVQALAKIGLQPDDFDLVINSHLHFDHAGCNQFFPRAKFLVQRLEMAAAQDPANEGKGFYRADWDYPLNYELLAGDHDVFGDGKLRLELTPGHTPGSMIIVLDLPQSGPMVLAADTVVLRENLEDGLVPKVTMDVAALKQSVKHIQRWRDNGAYIVYGHDDRQWDELKHAPAYYA